MVPSEEGNPATTMPEVAQLGLGSEEMPSPSSVAAAVAGDGEVEALAREFGGLELGGDEGRSGVGEKDVGGEGLEPEAAVEEGGRPADPPPHEVSGEKEAEESEAEKAWRGQEEWMEEKEVAKEGAGQEEEDENGGQQEKGKEGKGGMLLYPQRTGEPDCAYYLKTGFCAFGANCKFNHPDRGKRTQVVKLADLEKSQIKDREKEEHTGSVGQIQCKYYQTPGGCKYGSNCRYRHDGERSDTGPQLNFLGLPMRPGEKQCPFFLRTGSCKFGTNCRFHHPNPSGVDELAPASAYQDNGSSQQHASGGVSQQPRTAWSMQRCSNQSVSFGDTSTSCVPGMLLPHQLHQSPEWSAYQVPPNSLYPMEGNKKYPVVQTMYKPMTNMNGHSGQFQMQTEEYPERPGQPECQFYMDNGTCRYKSACRFHHPKDRLVRPPMCLLSPMGLPLRPDQPVCTYYSRYGICKFGPTCRFDHPMDRGSSKTHPQTTAVIP